MVVLVSELVLIPNRVFCILATVCCTAADITLLAAWAAAVLFPCCVGVVESNGNDTLGATTWVGGVPIALPLITQ